MDDEQLAGPPGRLADGLRSQGAIEAQVDQVHADTDGGERTRGLRQSGTVAPGDTSGRPRADETRPADGDGCRPRREVVTVAVVETDLGIEEDVGRPESNAAFSSPAASAARGHEARRCPGRVPGPFERLRMKRPRPGR